MQEFTKSCLALLPVQAGDTPVSGLQCSGYVVPASSQPLASRKHTTGYGGELSSAWAVAPFQRNFHPRRADGTAQQ